MREAQKMSTLGVLYVWCVAELDDFSAQTWLLNLVINWVSYIRAEKSSKRLYTPVLDILE